MPNYTITNGSTASAGTQQATAAAYASATLGIGSSTTILSRGKLYDILVGSNAAPGDTFVEWDVSRITVQSTATIVAAPPLDPADAACVFQVTVNSSTHGTISVPNLWYVGMNQRASYRWVCAPGSELVWPATASNGVQLRPRGSYTGTTTATLQFAQG